MTGATGVTGTSSTATTGLTASTSPLNPGGQLGQNSFLQLLVTQLQYQNPLQPQSNTQFISQLAQFTSLEQMTNVATEAAQTVSAVQKLGGTSQLSAAMGLLGDTVNVLTTSGQSATGAVTSVANQSGNITVTVNGQSYPLGAVTSIAK